MTSPEWYRRVTWTEQDREEFQTRLKRARQSSRSQYLRIQAVHLADVGNHAAALELLAQFFQVDDGSFDLAQAQLQYAESLAATKQLPKAFQAFRDCLDTERKRPNVITSAWLMFPWYVIEADQTDLFPEARKVLEEFEADRTRKLPQERYWYHGLKAILLHHEGQTPIAIEHANLAVAASQATHSGYRYHPRIGLVNQTDSPVAQRIAAIAELTGS